MVRILSYLMKVNPETSNGHYNDIYVFIPKDGYMIKQLRQDVQILPSCLGGIKITRL